MTDSTAHSDQAPLVTRGATGKRILYTILFILIIRVVEAVLAILILFELAFSLITEHAPSDRLRRFGDRVVKYGTQIGRFLTYNRVQPPFPFDDFPNGDEREDAGVGSPAAAPSI